MSDFGIGYQNERKPKFGKRPARNLIVDGLIFTVMTAYLILIMVKGGQEKPGFILACVIYTFISLRLLARHVSMSQTVYKVIGTVSAKLVRGLKLENGLQNNRPLTIAILVLDICLLVGSAAVLPLQEGTEFSDRAQSLIGIATFLALTAAFSRDFRAIPWHTVAVGILIQYFIAIFVLKTSIGYAIFKFMSNFISAFLKLSLEGAFFIFGEFVPDNFAKNVLPAIVFFCSFIYIVYYWGGMQYVVGKMSWLFVKIMDTSGAESVVACGSPFVGQGESALLVKPFIAHMTKSELHSTMTSGFATIAGSVLIFYLELVRDPATILTACVMSIPAGLLLSKIRYPEDGKPLTKGSSTVPEGHEKETNFLHAATNGAATGMQLIILISGSLLAIVSLFAAANYVVGWSFGMVAIYDWVTGTKADGTPKWVTIQLLLSYAFAPFAWLMGMPWSESRLAGEILATKMVVNEFVAYLALNAGIKENSFSTRTADLLAFGLCGFANFASIGIQIGALGAMAPKRIPDLAELAFSAMITGTVSTWLTACVAGALL